MAPVKVRVDDLNVWYNGFHALRSVGAEVPSKRITAVMGPSGCGKTTFIKCINRMVELVEGAKVSGYVWIDGVGEVYGKGVDVTEVRKRVGMVFQRPNPLPMSIFDNVAYGPKLHGVKGRELRQIVKECLMAVHLWDEVKDRLNEPAVRLSGGQQQRLCIARALALMPEVLLLDEPTSSLDPISADRVEELLLELKRDYTLILVTHNVQQAKRLADYVLFFYMGELVESGAADEVFKSPRHPKTAEYIKGSFG